MKVQKVTKMLRGLLMETLEIHGQTGWVTNTGPTASRTKSDFLL